MGTVLVLLFYKIKTQMGRFHKASRVEKHNGKDSPQNQIHTMGRYNSLPF